MLLCSYALLPLPSSLFLSFPLLSSPSVFSLRLLPSLLLFLSLLCSPQIPLHLFVPSRAKVGSYERFARTLGVGLWISLDYKYHLWGLEEETEERKLALEGCHYRAVEKIVKNVLSNGGLYIKLGQTFGSLNHVLPDAYVEGLRVLQDKASPQALEQVYATFMEEFETSPDSLFATFDHKPIAAASLAQVHRAITKDNEEVAVKVQFADLSHRFDSDLTTLTALLHLVKLIHPDFSFAWVLEVLFCFSAFLLFCLSLSLWTLLLGHLSSLFLISGIQGNLVRGA